MRKILLSLICLLTVTLAVHADNLQTAYQLSFLSDNWTGIQVYNTTLTSIDKKWEIQNFNNNNNGWKGVIKCGNKTSASVGSIYSKFAMPEEIAKVSVTIDAVTISSVNSCTLYISDTEDFSDPTAVTSDKTIAKGQLEFTIPTPASGKYYKVSIDCQKHSSTNGLVSVSGVTFYKELDMSKGIATLSWNTTPQQINIGETLDLADYLVTDPAAAKSHVSYSISDNTVASLENGIVTGLKKGNVTVSANIIGSPDYNDTETIEFNLTIFDPNAPLEETYTYTSSEATVNIGCVTISADKASGSTSPQYLSNGNAFRLYSGNTLTVSTTDEFIITEIIYTSESTPLFAASADKGSYSSGTWTCDPKDPTSKVVFKTTSNSRITSVTVKYAKAPAKVTLSFDNDAYEAYLRQEFTAPTLNGLPEGRAAVYSSSEPEVATVSEDGVVTTVAIGTTIITATFEGDADYAHATASYELTVLDPAKENVEIVWNLPESINLNETLDLTGCVTVTPETALNEVVFTCSDPNRAEIENGILTALKSGKTTLTASITDSETYNDFSVDAEIMIFNPDAFSLATSMDEIGDAASVIIVSGNVAMSTTQNTNNRGYVAITVNEDNTIDLAENVATFTMVKEGKIGNDDVYSFNDGTGYLYAASSSSNNLKTTETLNDNGKAAVSIDSESSIASVVFKGSNTRNVLQYNSSNGIFSCYGSASQSGVKLYYRPLTIEKKEVTFSGWEPAYKFPATDDMTYVLPLISSNSDGEVSYAIYEEDGETEAADAIVESGKDFITIMAEPGVYVIKASVPETVRYLAGETSATVEVTDENNPNTGVETIVDGTECEIITIDGVRVNGTPESLSPGLYIMRQGNRTVKILVK